MSPASRGAGRLLATLAVALLPTLAPAQSTWGAGGGNTNWSTAANWSTNPTIPDGGTDAIFGTAGSAAVLDSSRTVGTVTFNRAAAFTVSNSGGATLTVNTGLSAGTQNQSYTISAPVALGGATSAWAVTQNQILLSGAVSGSAAITKTGAGTVALSSATNSYTGAIDLQAGQVRFDAAGAVGGTGANITVASGAVAAFNFAAAQTQLARIAPASAGTFALGSGTNANALDFTGLTNVSFGSIGTMTYSGALTPAGTTYRLGGGGGVFTVSSALADSGGARSLLVIATSGIPVVANTSNSFSGGTTLRLNTLYAVGSVPASGASSLGTGPVLLGDASTAGTAGLLMHSAAGPTFARTISAVQAPTYTSGDQRYRIGVTSGVTGNSFWTGAVTWGQADATNTGRRRLEINNASAGVLDVSGLLDNNSAAAANARGAQVTFNGSGQGSGTIRISNPNNSFFHDTNNMTVARGTLIVAGNAPNDLAANSVLGRGVIGSTISLLDGATRYETVSGTYTNSIANADNGVVGLLMDGPYTLSRALTLANANTASYSAANGAPLAYVLGGTNTSGTATFAGTISNTLTSSGGTNVDALDKRIRLTAAAGGAVLVSGAIGRNGNYGSTSTDGSTTVYKEGAGIVVLTGTSSYDGPTELRNGVLLLGGNVPVGTGSGTSANGTDSPLGNDPSAIIVGSQTVPQTRSGTSLTNANVALTQATDNLTLMTNGAFTVARAVTVNNFGATVTLGGNAAAASAFTGTITLNRPTALGAVSGGTVTFGGVVQDGGTAGSVGTSGGGTIILTDNNTYTGGTTVANGTLLANGQVSPNSGTGTGAVAVSGGTFGGSGRSTGLVTVSGSGVFAPGTPSVVGTFNAAGGAAFTTGGTLRVVLAGSIVTAAADSGGSGTAGTNNSLLVGGATTGISFATGTGLVVDVTAVTLLADTPYSFRVGESVAANSLAGTQTISFVSGGSDVSSTIASSSLTLSGTGLFLNFTPVPEPTTVLGLAAAGLLLARRRHEIFMSRRTNAVVA